MAFNLRSSVSSAGYMESYVQKLLSLPVVSEGKSDITSDTQHGFWKGVGDTHAVLFMFPDRMMWMSH